MHILVVNGPNLNMLGKRSPAHYGVKRLSEICELLRAEARRLHVTVAFFSSNCEGAIIDFLQKASDRASGILINPGALTHYGYSLRDALEDTGLPVFEVHLSDISSREDFRKISVLEDVRIGRVAGKKDQSYLIGFQTLVTHIRKHETERGDV